jgi:hypothetical protein
MMDEQGGGRLKGCTVLSGGDTEGKVLSGDLSVEERMRIEAMKDRRRGERYKNVGYYDPVLRGHCRLDGEG